MIDTSSLLADVDLLSLAGRDTKLSERPIARTGGGEYAGPCPFCGGSDRFRVQPNHQDGQRWYCRGCGDERWHDAIAYVMRREKCDFLEACSLLGGDVELPARPRKAAATPQPKRHEAPAEEWQKQAREVVAECSRLLWESDGDRVRAWLNGRGLADRSLALWDVGYNPVDGKIAELFVPRGIVIPCKAGDDIWYVKVRRATGEPKYKQVAGGKAALFGAETLLEADRAAVLCEGEFDAMLLYQEAYDMPGVGVATLGSTSASLDVSIWARYLLPVSRFLIAYDLDAAGENSAENLAAKSARMRRAIVPKVHNGDKDLTDFYQAGGRLSDWLAFELAR